MISGRVTNPVKFSDVIKINVNHRRAYSLPLNNTVHLLCDKSVSGVYRQPQSHWDKLETMYLVSKLVAFD